MSGDNNERVWTQLNKGSDTYTRPTKGGVETRQGPPPSPTPYVTADGVLHVNQGGSAPAK